MSSPQSTEQVIDTGDVVLHRPTNQTWVVACVRDGKLSWCGWPEGTADLSDCELVTAATDAERLAMLHTIAGMDGNDHRGRYARWRLGQRETSGVH